MFRKPVVFLFALLLPVTMLALKPGDKAQELEIQKWVKGDPDMLAAMEGKSIVVLDFWATWLPICKETVPILCEIQNKYSADGVQIIGISTEDEPLVTKFVNERKFISYRIAVDDAKKTYKKYMGPDPGIPAVFVIGKDGKVLWKGHPMGLESVLDKVVHGKFDINVQKKITMLHDDLKGAMEKDNTGLVSNLADEILEKDPSDDIALRCKLYVFESQNRPADAIGYLNGLEKKLPGHFPFYTVELGILDRTGASAEEKRKVYARAINEFKDDPENLASLSMLISDGMSFGTGSARLALDAALRAFEILPKDASMRRRGICLNALARAYYSAGALEKAVQIQEDAVSSLSGYDDAMQAATNLKFYQEALEVGRGLITSGDKTEK